MHEHTTPPAALEDQSSSGAGKPLTDANTASPETVADTGQRPAPRGRKTALVGLASAVMILAAAGTVVAGGSLLPPPESSRAVAAAAAAVPAGASVGVCPGPARLLEGTEAGTDPQFSPESATAASAVTGAVLGAAGTLPASRLSQLDGTTAVEISEGPARALPPGHPRNSWQAWWRAVPWSR